MGAGWLRRGGQEECGGWQRVRRVPGRAERGGAAADDERWIGRGQVGEFWKPGEPGQSEQLPEAAAESGESAGEWRAS